jgi:hypothetical protein
MTAPRHLDLDGAADSIIDWGFLADPGTHRRRGPGYLIIAIRSAPTLAHYDPESVRFWVDAGDHAERLQLDRSCARPQEHRLSWGTILLADRLRVTNAYVTFGGVVTAARVDGTTVVIFLSPVPLLRRGGHSQGWDPLAGLAAAHFGRLAAAVGVDHGLDARVVRADPVARYAAFLADTLARSPQSGPGALDDADARLLLAERDRLVRTEPGAWRAGLDLAAAFGGASSA